MINALYTINITNTKGGITVLNFISKSEAYDAKAKFKAKGFDVDFDGFGYQIIRKASEVDSLIEFFE
jgi:hypothetical protein|tara:strand:- start:267 stop:467 length:201 start_codon:yes stop_codon:yes gene_type:complete